MSEKSGAHAQDLGGGLVLLTLGITVAVAASENPWLSSSGAVGPAAVPGVCGALLALLGVIQVGFALRARRHSAVESRQAATVAAGDSATTSTGASHPHALDLDDAIGAGDGANRFELHKEHPGTEDPATNAEGSPRQALLAWLGVIVAAITFNRIGALLTVTLLAAYLLAVVGRKGWRTTAIYTTALVGAVYLVFVVLLRIPLPTNPWMG